MDYTDRAQGFYLYGKMYRSRLDIDFNYNEESKWMSMYFASQLTMNDFSVHRIIGRGGFGEVYGCRKADTGKM